MEKMKKYVLTVSQKFPIGHEKEGEPTNFPMDPYPSEIQTARPAF